MGGDRKPSNFSGLSLGFFGLSIDFDHFYLKFKFRMKNDKSIGFYILLLDFSDFYFFSFSQKINSNRLIFDEPTKSARISFVGFYEIDHFSSIL
jgi:hypothetical protein